MGEVANLTHDLVMFRWCNRQPLDVGPTEEILDLFSGLGMIIGNLEVKGVFKEVRSTSLNATTT